jgi:hypothetical protein
LRNLAAFGFVLSVVLGIVALVLATAPTPWSKGVGAALITGMMVACWAAIATAIWFVIASDEPARR